MEILAGLLCLLPFVGLTALIVRDDGWRVALTVWAFTVVLAAPFLIGCWLLVA